MEIMERLKLHHHRCICGFCINKGDNFETYDSSVQCWEFAAIGEVSGLGVIKNIPTSGWARQVAVKKGYGYVAKYLYNDNLMYVRIYVVRYITDSKYHGVMGAEVNYQYPFVP